MYFLSVIDLECLQAVLPDFIPVIWDGREEVEDLLLFCKDLEMSWSEVIVTLFQEKALAEDVTTHQLILSRIFEAQRRNRSVRFFYNHWNDIPDVCFEFLFWLSCSSCGEEQRLRVFSVWQLHVDMKKELLSWMAYPENTTLFDHSLGNLKELLYRQIVS